MTNLAQRLARYREHLAVLEAELIGTETSEPIEVMPDPEPVSAQLGAVSPGLRAQMGDALADVFDNFGPEIYNGVVLALKDALKTAFEEGSKQIETSVQDELGARGIKAAQKHFRAWMAELSAVITQQGLADAAVAAADEASTLAAEFASEAKSMSEAPDLPGLEDIENIPDIAPEDTEVVEEKPAEADENAAPAFEGEAAGEGEAGGEVTPESIPSLSEVGAGVPTQRLIRRKPKSFVR